MASLRTRGETVSVVARVDGKQTSIPFYQRRDAERFLALVHLLGEGHKGDSYGWHKAKAEMIAEEERGYTLDEMAGAFFEWKARDVEARTLADYRRDYANWIQPFLGHRQAEAIDERDVQDLVDHMAQRLEAKSVADRHAILGAIYRFGSAKSRQLVSHNPCQETQLPKRHKKPAKGVTLAEWKELHAAALEVNPAAADLMLFIVATGWRFSEATALRVREVETIERQGRLITLATMRAVFRRDAENRRVLAEDAAKSEAGVRVVSLPESVAAVVGRRMVGKAPTDYVFTNPAGNPWRQNNFLYRTWPSVLRAAERCVTCGQRRKDHDGHPFEAVATRRPTPHWLRHGHVAMLNRADVSLPEMQRRLGHEDITTTINTYGRMIDDMSVESLDKLDALLSDAPGGQVVQGEVVLGELT